MALLTESTNQRNHACEPVDNDENRPFENHARQIFGCNDTMTIEHIPDEHNDQHTTNHVEPGDTMHDTNENTDERNTMNPPFTVNQANKKVAELETAMGQAQLEAKALTMLVHERARSVPARAADYIDKLLVQAEQQIGKADLRRPMDDQQ